MNPFDLTGPQFLGLYAVVALLALFVAVIVRLVCAGPSDPLPEDPRLHPYEWAHLAGGPQRVRQPPAAAGSLRPRPARVSARGRPGAISGAG